MKESYWKYSLAILILGLGYILFMQAKPFLNGILAGFTLYVLLRHPLAWMQRHINRTLSVWLLTIGVTLFMVIPICALVWAIMRQLSGVHLDTQAIIEPAERIIDFIKDKTGIDLLSENSMTFIVSQVSTFGQKLMSGVSDTVVNLCVAVLLLFFMLLDGRSLEKYIHTILPFKEKHKKEVLSKVELIVRSNAIGIPLLAVIQGLVAWFGYWVCNVPNPFITALLTGVASVIPLVGTAVIWVPMLIYLLVVSDWVDAGILLLYGSLVIAQSDNLIRFILQKKMANIHPLITIFGVVAGIPLFGFIGVIFGPLMVSMFLLFLDMFRREYLLPSENEE